LKKSKIFNFFKFFSIFFLTYHKESILLVVIGKGGILPKMPEFVLTGKNQEFDEGRSLSSVPTNCMTCEQEG